MVNGCTDEIPLEYSTIFPLKYSDIMREQNESKWTRSLYVIACFIYFVDL